MSTPHKTHNPGFLALVNDAKSRVKEIDIERYQKMPREGHVLIDVREDNEWAAGHAAGAIHLGKGIIERDIEQGAAINPPPWFCIAAEDSVPRWRRMRLQKMGYTNAISLDGGWRAWNAARVCRSRSKL